MLTVCIQEEQKGSLTNNVNLHIKNVENQEQNKLKGGNLGKS